MEESGYKLLPVCTRRIRASAVKCRYCGGVARKALQRASAGKPRLAGAGEVAAPAAAVRVETVPVMEDSRPELFRLPWRQSRQTRRRSQLERRLSRRTAPAKLP